MVKMNARDEAYLLSVLTCVVGLIILAVELALAMVGLITLDMLAFIGIPSAIGVIIVSVAILIYALWVEYDRKRDLDDPLYDVMKDLKELYE